MFDDRLQVVGLESVEYVEEVLAVRHATLRQLLREVSHELLVRLKHRPKFDDRKFVVHRH